MSTGRAVWVKVRASDAERAEWHAKARSVGLTLSDLVRRSLGRARTWTVPHAEVERECTREAARIGNNLNQIARWANTHKGTAEAVEVIARLVAIERALTALDPDTGDRWRLKGELYAFDFERERFDRPAAEAAFPGPSSAPPHLAVGNPPCRDLLPMTGATSAVPHCGAQTTWGCDAHFGPPAMRTRPKGQPALRQRLARA